MKTDFFYSGKFISKYLQIELYLEENKYNYNNSKGKKEQKKNKTNQQWKRGKNLVFVEKTKKSGTWIICWCSGMAPVSGEKIKWKKQTE